MGKIFRDATGDIGQSTTIPEIRKMCQRPGKKRADGTPLYFTEQQHKKECDVNNIIRKYDKTGLITHVSRFEGTFGDLSGADFKEMSDRVAKARSMFEELPSNIRHEFKNDPSRLLQFMDDPGNRAKAEKLGLINKGWTEDSDGLGEHVPEGKNKMKKETPETPAA